MTKTFNITGTCIPDRHYTADISEKLDKIIEIISRGDYFTINRPHQYGKTTIMYLLEQRLKKDKSYLAIDISFEGIDTAALETSSRFVRTILSILNRRLKFMQEKEMVDILESNMKISDFEELNAFFTDFIVASGRKVVLMIDEVDQAGNNRLFLDFLGLLRAKYLKRNEGKDYTFHSVILAGIHDVKSLKSKIRRGEKPVYNSPWNIAVDFDVELSLSPGEIASMLQEYVMERQVTIDIPFFAEYLFYFTSGYPFLVSCLCKIIDEKILPAKAKNEWKPEDLVSAVQIVVMKDNTNFEGLVKNLVNNPDLYEFVFKIIMNGMEFSYNPHNSIIHRGMLHGILRKEKGKIQVHNRIYEQIIYNYMSSNLETSTGIGPYNIGSNYIDENGVLNIEKVIRKFQQFMKEQYSVKDTAFIERNGRLLFLSFIKPIINGKGFDFKEVQVSEEKRLDVAIIFGNMKYIVELKIWRGEAYHQEGIRQLCDYLDRQNETVGYLLVYDLRKKSGQVGEWQKLETRGKQIFIAWI
ncbi:MAG: AAA-like domain-containing protein [Candidatus Aminicenantes bacterium]|nr:AAA-like domain-containing protein [Candidatus Aminicenantes bacterium]